MKNPGSVFCRLWLLLLFACLATPVQGASQITLTGMEKQESPGRTKITLSFSELPNFEIDHSGQRLDLLLKDVRTSAKLQSLPEDETVIKILLAQKYKDLLSSFLLRRPPVQVHTESLPNPPRIVMDLSWQQDQSSRPGVAFRIADMPPRKAGKKAQEYTRDSPWKDRWLEFFREYRSAWALQLPLQYTQAELPRLVSDEQNPLWILQQQANEKQWLSLLRTASTLNGLDQQQLYLQDLLVAEAQVRSGALAAGLARLQRLQGQPHDQQNRVEYLTAYAQANNGQPYLAQFSLEKTSAQLSSSDPLFAPLSLLAAETALAAKQAQLALSYLEHLELVWPVELLEVADLRRADALAALGQPERALEIYQGLLEVPDLFAAYPFSSNRAAYTAYQQHRYPFSARLYRQLAELWKEQPGDDLVLFAVGAASYASGDLEWGIIGLQKATLERPNSEGSGRADLLLLDNQLLRGGQLEMAQAAAGYGQLSKISTTRQVREEAAFKRALSLYLLEDYADSVAELMRFRREFSSSKLRREADLLLLEQLPLVVHQLLEQENDLQAVVLVEQNRNLLLRGGFSREFLQDLAGAFNRLGLYARAGRVLLYLFDQAANDALRQPIYLPLAQSYLKREEFSRARDYAGRYLKKYPQGTDAGALFALLLDALERQGQQEQSLVWLNRQDRPSSPQLEVRAAWIYWQQQQLPQVIASLERVKGSGEELAVKEMALLAEAYYLLRKNQQAKNIYRQLRGEERFAGQARYRSAQLLLRQEDRAGALNLLAQLVDEDGGSRWGKLAQDLLIQENSRAF